MIDDRRQDLAGFRGHGYDKGRSITWQLAWYICSHLIFQKWWCPPRIRPSILRVFGADIGPGVYIRQRVRVHWPWKLEVGGHVWIGEGVWLLNLERIRIGSHVCLSQESILCTGSHNRHSSTFEFDNGPIAIGDECWIAIQSLILRGVTLPKASVVPARSVVTRNAIDPRRGTFELGLSNVQKDHSIDGQYEPGA